VSLENISRRDFFFIHWDLKLYFSEPKCTNKKISRFVTRPFASKDQNHSFLALFSIRLSGIVRQFYSEAKYQREYQNITGKNKRKSKYISPSKQEKGNPFLGISLITKYP